MAQLRIRPSARSSHIRYAVRDIILLADQAAQSGKTMTYLNIGDPLAYDFATPLNLIEAAHAAMVGQKNGYSHSSGIDEALDAVKRAAGRQGIRNIEEVFITTGASEAIELALSALVDQEDEVLIPSPGYPLYSAVLAKLETTAVSYDLDEDKGWEPDLADIEAKITRRTKAIVIINPNNPTGAVYSEATLRAVIDLARRHQLVIFADEIYDRLVFAPGKKHLSIASLADDVVFLTFNGLSKGYLAPGFRIGWGILSGDKEAARPFADAILKFTRARLCPSHPMQYCIKPALDGDQSHLPQVLQKLQARAELTSSMMQSIPGVSLVPPAAAFYAFPRLNLGIPDAEFVRNLVLETGVVVVPGSGFGQKEGTSHVRIVFLPDEVQLRRAYTAFADIAGRYRAVLR